MMFLMAFLTIVGKKCHKKYIMLSYYLPLLGRGAGSHTAPI